MRFQTIAQEKCEVQSNLPKVVKTKSNTKVKSESAPLRLLLLPVLVLGCIPVALRHLFQSTRSLTIHEL